MIWYLHINYLLEYIGETSPLTVPVGNEMWTKTLRTAVDLVCEKVQIHQITILTMQNAKTID